MVTPAITVSDIRMFFGLDTSIVSDAQINQVLGYAATFVALDFPTSMPADERKVLELFKFGAMFFAQRNPSNYLKRGISDWSVGRIGIKFDIVNIAELGKSFNDEYQRLLFLATQGGQRGYAGFTNTGTGLWQNTQKMGPLFVRVGSNYR